MRHPWRLLKSALPIFAIVALAGLVSGCGGPYPQSALRPASDFATSLDDLFQGIFFWAVIVFVVVEGALLVAVFRFRDREGKRSAEHVHGNTILEVSWTIAPALILVLIAVPTIRTIWEVDRPTTDPDALLIEAVGHQWWGEFRYPDLGIVTANEIHVPVGRTIDIRLTSADVIHSFWFPRAGGKRDVIPGHENQLWFKMDSVGVFPGQCAEFCGMSHALMKMEMVSESEEAFEAWVALQQKPALGTGDTAAPTEPEGVAEGEDVPEPQADPLDPGLREILDAGNQAFLGSGCIACHRIEGTVAAGVLGPDLTHVGSRRTIAAGILENTPENMARWLQDPSAVKPGSLMPKMPLDEDTIRTLVAYLESLK